MVEPTILGSGFAWASLAAGVSVIVGWSVLIIRFVGGVRGAPTLARTTDQELPGPDSSTRVTAVVPTRNEESNISGCLSSLVSQCGLQKVIVVDDGSTDGTKEAVEGFSSRGLGRSPEVRFLEGQSGSGFGGKPLACQAGADKAAGEWLLFVDADTRLRSGTLSSALSLADSKGLDALSGVGEIRCPGLWDKLGTPFVFAVLNALFKMSDVNDPDKDAAYFYGSFVLIKRERYIGMGGHAAVAGEVVEDKALGALAKRAGLKIEVVRAPGLISAEWAPGLRNWVGSLQRVVAPTMRGTLGLSLGFCLTLSLLILGPPLLLLAGFGGGLSQSVAFALGVLSFLLAVLLTGLAARLIGSGWFYSALYIVPAAAVVGALWVSLFKAWRGGTIEWRGRSVKLGRP